MIHHYDKNSGALTKCELQVAFLSKLDDVSSQWTNVTCADCKAKMEGIKFDSGKPLMNLLSSRWLKGTAEVLTAGARKYSSHNWRKGMKFSRCYDALQRHMLAWNDGQDLDLETGLSHLYHASCCLMFLAELSETRTDLDDRYKQPVHEEMVPGAIFDPELEIHRGGGWGTPELNE